MIHTERSHVISLPLPVERAFPLFTPKGEMDWIADWKPQFIYPEDGRTCEGMVFTTWNGDDPTFWSCVEWDAPRHRVRYTRVTPSAKFGQVAVNCRELGPRETEIQVVYTYTALSPQGEEELAAFTQPVFEKMVNGWRELIVERYAATESA